MNGVSPVATRHNPRRREGLPVTGKQLGTSWQLKGSLLRGEKARWLASSHSLQEMNIQLVSFTFCGSVNLGTLIIIFVKHQDGELDKLHKGGTHIRIL